MLVGTATDVAVEPIARRVADDVYLEAARERADRAAERVATAVTRAGGEAITADPEALPPAIALLVVAAIRSRYAAGR